MGCQYCDVRTGKCHLNDGSIEMPGVDENGYCISEEDPNPLETCESYMSNDEDF